MPLKIVKRGKNPNYYLRGTRPDRKPFFESTQTDDLATAEALRTQIEARWLEEKIHGPASTVTFDEAAEDFVKSGGSPRYLMIPRKRSSPGGLMLHFGSRRLATITQSDLDAAAKKLFPSAKPETLTRQCYAPFIAVWNHAVRNEWAKERKWQRPRKLKGTAQRQEIGRAGQRPVTYERAWQFVEAASPAAAMVMTALFYTGMRPIELFGLLREDVDVAGRWIVVHASKTGEPRGVPMHEMLAPLFEALHKQPKPTGKNQPDAVFRTHKGQPYPMLQNGGGQLKSAILGARGRLGKEAPADISPYTARHTVSTQLVVAGVHPYIKDQILGHAADDMSRHYTNIPQKPLLEAINSLPVIPAWRDAAWLHDPLEFRNKLTRYVNHGRRGNPKDEPAEPAKEQTFSVRS